MDQSLQIWMQLDTCTQLTHSVLIIGIELVDDLIADLEGAMLKAREVVSACADGVPS